MSFSILFVFLLVMLFSLGISIFSRTASLGEDPDAFLFGGNSRELASTSSVGSFLSVTVIFTLFAVGTIGYGFATLAATLAGVVSAYVFLAYAGRRLASRSNTLPRLLTSHLSSNTVRSIANTLIIAQYGISLICEFSVFRSMLSGYDSEFPAFAVVTTLIIGFLCATWVVLGGYSGVLRTDFFQLMIFALACVIALRFIVGPGSAIGSAALLLGAWDWPSPVATATWLTFTFATFVAFPDVWVRNFGSLTSEDFGSRSFFARGLLLLLLALVPILALSCYAAAHLGAFDHVYDVQRSLDFFMQLFQSTTGVSQWLVAAAFLCVFVTTVDTWLIGVAQHAVELPARYRGTGVTAALPYGFGIGAAAASAVVSGDGIYVLGLFVFPFLYLNVLLFCGKVWPGWHRASGEGAYLLAWSVGIFATAVQLGADWPNRMANAPYIIWNAMWLEFITYGAVTLVRLLKGGRKR